MIKRWFIDIEETQNLLDERYSANSYLIEQKDDTIEIFVNELMDKDLSVCSKEILKTFKLDRYTICVYTSAKDEELHFQLSAIYFAILNSSERIDPFIEKKFIELHDKIFNPEFTKKSQELVDKLISVAIDLHNYRSQQAVYSNGKLRSEIENVYKDIVDLVGSIKESCKDIQ